MIPTKRTVFNVYVRLRVNKVRKVVRRRWRRSREMNVRVVCVVVAAAASAAAAVVVALVVAAEIAVSS